MDFVVHFNSRINRKTDLCNTRFFPKKKFWFKKGIKAMGWVIISGEGGYKTVGGHVKFYPYGKKGGGAHKVLPCLEGGGAQKVSDPFCSPPPPHSP